MLTAQQTFEECIEGLILDLTEPLKGRLQIGPKVGFKSLFDWYHKALNANKQENNSMIQHHKSIRR